MRELFLNIKSVTDRKLCIRCHTPHLPLLLYFPILNGEECLFGSCVVFQLDKGRYCQGQLACNAISSTPTINDPAEPTQWAFNVNSWVFYRGRLGILLGNWVVDREGHFWGY